MSVRPALKIDNAETSTAVHEFVAGLQAGHDQRDADVLNRQFASDIAWGSPYGALIDGYDQLHPIHAGFQRHPRHGPPFRYEVRHMLPVSGEIIIAHVARLALSEDGEPLPASSDPNAPFSEMALYVLVRRDGEWWVAAAQHTPIRPGGAVSTEPVKPGRQVARDVLH